MNLPAPFYAAGDHIGIDLAGARAVFTTRRGGCSTGPYESLNLGRLTEDRPEHVAANRASLGADLALELTTTRQVHGTTVVTVTSPQAHDAGMVEADGQATAVRDVGPMMLTADCLPIVIAASAAVAVVHAGWRGLAGGVVARGVEAVRRLDARGELEAAIGPGAGPCCYEVGEDVHAVFEAHGPNVRRGSNLDLKAVARAELVAAGVAIVHDLQLCTICAEPTLFYSHRRDRGITGRQGGVAWLT